MTIHPRDRGIDHRVFHVRLTRSGVEHALDHIRLHPVTKTLEHRVSLAEHRRQVAPRTACPRNAQHRLCEQPRVASRPSGIDQLAQSEGLHLLPLRVRQTEAIHAKLLSELESQRPQSGNPLILNRPWLGWGARIRT